MSPVINKIEKEFIFKFLIQNKVSIEIKYKHKSTYANILEQNSKELKIEILSLFDELLEPNAEILIFFYFQNNYHTFKSNIFKIKNNIAIIMNPPTIAKNVQRKFERIKINGKLMLSFNIKGDLIKLNFPETTAAQYFPNKPPIEADFYDIKIENMLEKFKIKISDYVSYNKIKMLRNIFPTEFEEQMVIKYGKTLYIPNIFSDIPQKQIIDSVNIILKPEWAKFETLKNKTQPYLTNKAITDYLKQLSKNDIFSKAIIPVLYRNYIVAFIYLTNDSQRNVPINIKILTYAYQFSRLLSYTLKENNYFIDEEKNIQKYEIPIYDLSPGGLAIMNNNNSFEDKLLLNHNLNFSIDINSKKIRLSAKLVRKYQETINYFYGFMFIDIKKEDHDFLTEYLNSL